MLNESESPKQTPGNTNFSPRLCLNPSSKLSRLNFDISYGILSRKKFRVEKDRRVECSGVHFNYERQAVRLIMGSACVYARGCVVLFYGGAAWTANDRVFTVNHDI